MFNMYDDMSARNDILEKEQNHGMVDLEFILGKCESYKKEISTAKWYQNSIAIFPKRKVIGMGIDAKIHFCVAALFIPTYKYKIGINQQTYGCVELPDQYGFLIGKQGKIWMLVDQVTETYYKLPNDIDAVIFVESEWEDGKNGYYMLAAKDEELDLRTVAISTNPNVVDAFRSTYNFVIAYAFDEENS